MSYVFVRSTLQISNMPGQHPLSQRFLTWFQLGGYQIDTCLPFSLYCFHSESEQPDWNRVKLALPLYLITPTKILWTIFVATSALLKVDWIKTKSNIGIDSCNKIIGDTCLLYQQYWFSLLHSLSQRSHTWGLQIAVLVQTSSRAWGLFRFWL